MMEVPEWISAKILVMDEESAILRATYRILEAAGYATYRTLKDGCNRAL